MSNNNTGSPGKQSDVWKVLHGAPPTPLPPRRDPDRNPIPAPTAGQQQKAALAAQQVPYSSPNAVGGNSPGQLSNQQQIYSTGSLDTLHLPPAAYTANARGAGQLRSSLDNLVFRQQFNGLSSPEQQQYGGVRQAWGAGGPAAPTGRLLPSLDGNITQVCSAREGGGA